VLIIKYSRTLVLCLPLLCLCLVQFFKFQKNLIWLMISFIVLFFASYILLLNFLFLLVFLFRFLFIDLTFFLKGFFLFHSQWYLKIFIIFIGKIKKPYFRTRIILQLIRSIRYLNLFDIFILIVDIILNIISLIIWIVYVTQKQKTVGQL
jgi:hypothetical protein